MGAGEPFLGELLRLLTAPPALTARQCLAVEPSLPPRQPGRAIVWRRAGLAHRLGRLVRRVLGLGPLERRVAALEDWRAAEAAASARLARDLAVLNRAGPGFGAPPDAPPVRRPEPVA